MHTEPSALSAHPAADARSTGFGTTLLDTLMPGEAGAARRGPASVFDVCHAGVVLRTLLAVEAAVGLGTLFVAADFEAWSLRFASTSAVAVPAVLLWLSTACLLERPLGVLVPGLRWAVAGRNDGKLRFTMENGQVWKQIDSTTLRNIGQAPWTAEIRKASFGSFLLSLNGGRAVRVERVN